MRKAIDGPAGDELLTACRTPGLGGPGHLRRRRPLHLCQEAHQNAAGRQGLKIRVPQTDLWIAAMTAMGANPTPMPIGEVYTGLKTGLIDAAENNLPS